MNLKEEPQFLNQNNGEERDCLNEKCLHQLHCDKLDWCRLKADTISDDIELDLRWEKSHPEE